MSLPSNIIAKIDLETAREWLPIFMNKGIFNNFNKLPERSEILEQAKHNLGLDVLTDEQKRTLLSEVGIYKTRAGYVVRDYRDYIIAFGMKWYRGSYVNGLDDKEVLKQVKLYKLGYNVALYLLSEVYRQKKCLDLEIEKKKMLETLGYSTSEKQIYKDLDEVMFSLRWLDYQIIRFRMKSEMAKVSGRMQGNFIYNLFNNKQKYVVCINHNFVGCIVNFFNKKLTKENLKRGYFYLPTSVLAMTRSYSSYSMLMVSYLLMQKGNTHLNTDTHKVIAQKARYIAEICGIKEARDYEIKKKLIKMLNEVDIIDHLQPSITELEMLKPAEFIEQNIKIYIKKSVKDIDNQIQSNLLTVKSGQEVIF